MTKYLVFFFRHWYDHYRVQRTVHEGVVESETAAICRENWRKSIQAQLRNLQFWHDSPLAKQAESIQGPQDCPFHRQHQPAKVCLEEISVGHAENSLWAVSQSKSGSKQTSAHGLNSNAKTLTAKMVTSLIVLRYLNLNQTKYTHKQYYPNHKP